jgi:hypothetical protein
MSPKGTLSPPHTCGIHHVKFIYPRSVTSKAVRLLLQERKLVLDWDPTPTTPAIGLPSTFCDQSLLSRWDLVPQQDSVTEGHA